MGVGSLLRSLFVVPGSLACQDEDGPELALLLAFCNFRSYFIIVVLWSGGLRRMHVFRKGELGVGSIFVCIITSLASGGVMVLPKFVVVVEGCDAVNSIVRSMGAHVSAL
jgi:hypothetical protein